MQQVDALEQNVSKGHIKSDLKEQFKMDQDPLSLNQEIEDKIDKIMSVENKNEKSEKKQK